MPYAVRADPSWDMRLIPHATCGDPVLMDQYVLTWRGARLTLTVAAVPSESSRVRDQAELSKLESTIHHTPSGQAYSLIDEPQGPVSVLRAALAGGGYSYILKLQGGSNAREVREALVAIIARWQTHALEHT
ncbi:MAG: hypothetical protein M1296_06835 [Chloroflexi bacterium]|nr:hypothetical protein [Chloroflexota bacterium]